PGGADERLLPSPLGALGGVRGAARRPPQLRSRLLRARQRVLQGVGWRLARPRHVPRLDGEARDGDPHPLGVPLLHRRMSYTPNEIMTVEAARRLANGTVCFV